MAFKLTLSVALLLALCPSAVSDVLMEAGVLQMECRDNYFMIAVLAITEQELHFRAVDNAGVYVLRGDYMAQCGYSINALPSLGIVELRASFLSCHTERKGDLFVFNFNLITNLEGEETTYRLNKTCPRPHWSPREVSCEVNYMEVSVQHEPTCSSQSDTWSFSKPVYSSWPSDWHVAFQKPDGQLTPMNVSEARKHGHMFELTHGRIVFRTPYGQPDSYTIAVNGVQEEVVHASLVHSRGWLVTMIDLIAACALSEGSFDGNYMMWDTPRSPYPSLHSPQMSVGLNGDLVKQAVAEQRGFIVDMSDTLVRIGIPYDAEGVYRKSFIRNGLCVFYIYNLYWKQISLDENNEVMVNRYYRTLVSPLLPHPLAIEDQTFPDEGMFKVLLGNVPEDVELTFIQLNGQIFDLPMTNESAISITEEAQPNNTYGYTLRVPFRDPVVVQELPMYRTSMLHKLSINYTLTVPGSDPYYYTTLVTALTDVSPPALGTNCSASGITFTLVYRPSDHLWMLSVGTEPLTMDLAAERGYIMMNDSRSLTLLIPLYTPGYKYKDFSAKGFSGTFEILVRDRHTSQIQASSVQTCHFESQELITCAPDGTMTVVADIPMVIPSGQILPDIHLYSKQCKPNEVNGARMFLSIPVNTCGSIVKLTPNTLTYQNKVFYINNGTSFEGLMLQCTYPLSGLHQLFLTHEFKSTMKGVGNIIRNVPITPAPATTKVPVTTKAPPKTKSPVFIPSYQNTVRYIKVSSAQNPANFRRGSQGYLQVYKQQTFK